MNVFETPQFFREEILKLSNLVNREEDKYTGKSLICVFFTSYCGVGCPFCFFSSPSPIHGENVENKFNADGVDKFIEFANSANVGYLQISGGGEPFLEKEAIIKSIEHINADRIILVTSGIWACNIENAEKYLLDLKNALSRRTNKTRLSIRLSVSKDHNIKLKNRPLYNLLQLFEKKYKYDEDFTLQLKTFDNDDTLTTYLDKFNPGCKIEYIGKNCSDDENHIKVMPQKFRVIFDSGYSVIIGQSRIFNSNLRPNMNIPNSIANTINVYDQDTSQSQSDFPSLVFNSNGKPGIDWIIEYNGNVCAWQNRVQDNLLNIYEDKYDYVVNKTLSDPLTLSFIEKGAKYREKIIQEVAPHTVKLVKAVSIRDYAGTLLFEDEKTRLYYTLRVLQDYMKEGRINQEIFRQLPSEIRSILQLTQQDLVALYKKSNYSILSQELSKNHNAQTFGDFLELVKLGHYKLNAYDIQKAIKYYNSISGCQISSIDEIPHLTGIDVERRFTKRVMTMKKLGQNTTGLKHIYIYRHGETFWNTEGIVKGQMDDLNVSFTDKGLEQINTIAQDMKFNQIEEIYASDLARTKNTALLANTDLQLPLSFHSELRALNMGKYQGKPFKDFISDPAVQTAFINHDICIPDGESINQLNTRLFTFLNKIVSQTTAKNIAIIMHSAAISNLKAYITKEKYEDIERCEILYANKKFTVIKTRQKTY